MRKIVINIAIIIFAANPYNFGCSDDKIKMASIIEGVYLAVPQKEAAAHGFYRRGDNFFCWDGSREIEINQSFSRTDFLIQSKNLLLTGHRYFPDQVTVYQGARAIDHIPISGFEFLCNVDKTDDRLFLAGLKERSRWLFQLVDDRGRLLNEFALDDQDRTVVNDQTILFSLLDEKYWFVWIPSHLEILVFDHALNLLRTRRLAIPDHLQAMNLPFLKARDRLAEDRDALIGLCSAHTGEVILTLPIGFFQVGQHLALCFDVNRLEGCRREFWQDPEKFWQTGQSSEILYLDKQTFEWDIQTIPDLKVTGLFGLNGHLLGYRVNPGGKTWEYQLSHHNARHKKQ